MCWCRVAETSFPDLIVKELGFNWYWMWPQNTQNMKDISVSSRCFYAVFCNGSITSAGLLPVTSRWRVSSSWALYLECRHDTGVKSLLSVEITSILDPGSKMHLQSFTHVYQQDDNDTAKNMKLLSFFSRSFCLKKGPSLPFTFAAGTRLSLS